MIATSSFVRRRGTKLLAAVIGLLVAGPAIAQATAPARPGDASPREQAVEHALAVMPESVGRVVIVPNLSATAGTLNELLAGMNRAQLLLGADPVDQLMGLLGFSRHVDRFGSIMIGWIEPESLAADAADAPDANARPAARPGRRVVAAVPSRDPEAFLATNFAPGTAPGTVVDTGGRVLHARVTERHVVLSASAMDGLVPMGLDRARARRAAWPPSTSEMLRGDDIVLVGLPRGLTGSESPILGAIDLLLRRGAIVGPGGAVVETLAGVAGAAFDPSTGPIATEADQIAMSVRFDPLALILRGAITWRDAGAAAPNTAPNTAPNAAPNANAPAGREPDPLQLLSADAGLIVAGWDRHDPAARASMDRLLGGFGWSTTDGWPGVDAVAMRLPVHRGGFPGGLLAGTTMMARGSAAAARANATGPWLTLPGWALTTSKAADEEPGAWNLRRVPGPDGPTPGGTMVMLGLAGPRGLVGTVAPGPGTGERSTMLARVRTPADGPDALAGAEAMLAAAPGYADDPIADLMLTMMARRPHLAAFLDVAGISQWVAEASREQPLLGRIDPIAGEQPPIGIGIAGHTKGADGTAIIPAPLAVIAFDALAAEGLGLLGQLTGSPDAADVAPGGVSDDFDDFDDSGHSGKAGDVRDPANGGAVRP
ncbi:MAG: hypothetical protein AB8G96_09430 [Phycisphaerales bacterium]